MGNKQRILTNVLFSILAGLALMATAISARAQSPACQRTITADVAAINQPFMVNRLGAAVPNGMVFALMGDVVAIDTTKPLGPGNVQLRGDKRARPLVLRANAGDCLKVNFRNFTVQAADTTPQLSLHVQGMQVASSIGSDGSFAGANASSLADPAAVNVPSKMRTYTLFAQEEGAYLLYTLGDSSTTGDQLEQGLFGAVNVQPAGALWYRSQVGQKDMALAIDRSKGNNGMTPDGHPILNYNAVYPAGTPRAGTPILRMLNDSNQIIYTDLTAIITGPTGGRFPNSDLAKPNFRPNPASPDRLQPFREVTVIYHETPSPQVTAQAFPIFSDPSLKGTFTTGPDLFSINYGTGGIAPEIYANRIGVGPMGGCADCKFEEFFLSAWSVGDPAMVVDVPANAPYKAGTKPPPLPQTGTSTPAGFPSTQPYTVKPQPKATMAFYPDDPSNVYHSYLNDHVKFRIHHGGTGITHVHHQHAHQWLSSPNSDDSTYLDSQMISPGASYTLEMTYNGSGNRNKTVGDSIFHCHFYPHFAGGMWAMWRVHDVFEAGTQLDNNGKPIRGARALPDGEITAGTPIPALVPLPTLGMAPLPSPVFIQNGQVVYGTPQTPDPNGTNVTQNPGFPFFIPGKAGARPPHPPLDFAPDLDAQGNQKKDANGNLLYLDGGLPRHLVTGGTITNEQHTATDWSKDLAAARAIQLPEDGTGVEKVAMKYFGQRQHSTFLPNGNPGSFTTNGLPRKTAQNPTGAQSGAPFADPAVDDNGGAIGNLRRYKAAAIQLDVTLNPAAGTHYPQQRILTLWKDVAPTLNYSTSPSTGRKPEPLFFRANSGDVVEYWHTNLVPNYYLLDNFQVRTPTDILGQHIHLVKFDVTSSDGAANGFNYEDGTFSPEEVQEIFKAVKNTGGGGSWLPCAGCTPLRVPQPPPADICAGVGNPCQKNAASWMGAQTTIQRWYVDPLVNNQNEDRTLGTVFTHDHFGPSTHQQAGLYAGLVVEPRSSSWTLANGTPMYTNSDGSPTSAVARIINNPNPADSYREFLLEFQDLQLAYNQGNTVQCNKNGTITTIPQSQCPVANIVSYVDNAGKAIRSPGKNPQLVSIGLRGTYSLNYSNEPIPRGGGSGDLSFAFSSIYKNQGDPATPLLRAYQGDKVQIRTLVGAHLQPHFFNLQGLKWLAEPSWSNSGYRASQAMGLSEHFELKFNIPTTTTSSSPKCGDGAGVNCADYLYIPSADDTGYQNGLWGLLRAYNSGSGAQNVPGLAPLPNNTAGKTVTATDTSCPAGAPVRQYNVTATTTQLTFNKRGLGTGDATNQINNPFGITYTCTPDPQGNCKPKPGAPNEPLILRAAAGECLVVTLTNAFNPSAPVFTNPSGQQISPPSTSVGLNPQLLSYDVTKSNGANVGYNPTNQLASIAGVSPCPLPPCNQTVTYRWYAGNVELQANGSLKGTPVEFGTLNLLPSDPLFQHPNGLVGAIVIEPQGSKWTEDTISRASATVTKSDGTTFREFVVMVQDDAQYYVNGQYISTNNNNYNDNSGINYGTEPMDYRYGNLTGAYATNGNNQAATSNSLVGGDPRTPVFTAPAGTPVRFRLAHSPGIGPEVFTINGHVWQRQPYMNNSTQIGPNPLSQWIGSRDNHGATDHFDLVIDKAGGKGAVPGDYLYSVFLPGQANLGMWGIFRVTPPYVAGRRGARPAAAAMAAAPVVPVAAPPPAPGATAPPRKEDALEPFRKQGVSSKKKDN